MAHNRDIMVRDYELRSEYYFCLDHRHSLMAANNPDSTYLTMICSVPGCGNLTVIPANGGELPEPYYACPSCRTHVYNLT